jgi:phospho-N-acetylmuramoyl-pentapeptide-transferase
VIGLLISAGVAMLVSLIGTRFLIRFFRSRNKYQPILGPEDRGPAHQHKAGTPTMGGIAILGSAFIGYVVSHVRRGIVFSNQVLVMFGGVLLLALIGFFDDYLKVRKAHNRGILWKRKSHIMLAVSALIATALVLTTKINTRLAFTRADFPGWQLGKVGWVIWATIIIFTSAHAFNVTDGLDGLATGSAIFGFFAFTIIAFWGFRNPTIYVLNGGIVNPLDLAVFAVAFVGACAGFLWWNAAPARIFMGDVGALGLGTALALLALTTNTHLLLPLIAGLNVMEIMSVALQMGTYKFLNHRRIFKNSPIHHHFEMVGWPETTVIIRFWIISGICVASALGLYYADFARLTGIG